MDAKRGIRGRRVCGALQAVFGVFLFIGTIVTASDSEVTIPGLLSAALTLLTGSLGIASKTPGLIIGYMVTGSICVLAYGFSTVGGIKVVQSFEDYAHYIDPNGYKDGSAIRVILLVAVVIVAVVFIISVLGVIFACLPLYAVNHGQDGQVAFQFQRFNEPAGTVGPPPDYNYSNTGFVHTAQTEQNANGNNPVGAVGPPPDYNYSNTGFVHTAQTEQNDCNNKPVGVVGPPPDYNYSNTGLVHTAQTEQNDYGNKPVDVGGAPLTLPTAIQPR